MHYKITSEEKIDMFKYDRGMRNHCLINSNKLFVFHSNEKGETSVDKFFLRIFSLLGYTFITCYPKTTRNTLGFGKYLYGHCDKVIQIGCGIDFIDVNPVIKPVIRKVNKK